MRLEKIMASIARLPPLQNIGGQVTQQVLSQIPSPPKFGGAKVKSRLNVYTKNKPGSGMKETDNKSKIDTQR